MSKNATQSGYLVRWRNSVLAADACTLHTRSLQRRTVFALCNTPSRCNSFALRSAFRECSRSARLGVPLPLPVAPVASNAKRFLLPGCRAGALCDKRAPFSKTGRAFATLRFLRSALPTAWLWTWRVNSKTKRAAMYGVA